MDRTGRCLEVRRDDLRTTRVVAQAIPDLTAGQALLRIDRFGLTSNNVTYGVVGDVIGYWNFFPATDGWGRIPVWGFAEVVASQVDGLQVGTRVFGYLPMASHLVVEPTRLGSSGFADGASHRARLPAVYNRYLRTAVDPLHSPETEDLQAVFVPLFVTSFVLDDFLADNADFGATQIVLSSASSKTAAGTALCISGRDGPRPDVVGLTSAAHGAFVAQLGCYDSIASYDNLESLDTTQPTVFVDIAGNAEVRSAVHRRFADALTYSCTVGISHWDAPRAADPLPGPQPTLFFAPSQIDKRVSEWGQDGYQQRLAAAWDRLLTVAGQWVTIREVADLAGLQAAYLQLLQGTTSPDEALVVRIEP